MAHMNPNRRKSTRCVEDEYPRPVRSRSLLKAHDSAEDVYTVSNSSEQHICLLWSRILLYLAFRNCSCVHDVSFILSLFSVFSVFGVSPLPATTCVCDLCYKWSVYGCGVYISRTDVCNIYIYIYGDEGGHVCSTAFLSELFFFSCFLPFH